MTAGYLTDVEIRMPSLVRVTDAAGALIAVIHPLTRVRRAVTGEVERTLTPQGWALTTARHISWPGAGRRARPVLAPIERTRSGKIRDRDARVGQGRGGGRPRSHTATA
jgi:hypothetical protein